MREEIRAVLSGVEMGTSQLVQLIQEMGLSSVADIVVEEIQDRAAALAVLRGDSRPMGGQVRFCLSGTDGKELVRMVPRKSLNDVSRCVASVHQELGDLACSVFGSGNNLTRRIVWEDDTPVTPQCEVPQVAQCVYDILRCTETSRPDLTELALAHRSDKWGLHFYTQHYERYFEAHRGRHLVLLEIGVGGFDDPRSGGGSLQMWQQYFPRGEIYGLDVQEKDKITLGQRVEVLRGNQRNAADLQHVVDHIGVPDVVIDDGSHQAQDIMASFWFLFPLMRPGGLYVIEDLQTSYWPKFGGGYPQPQRGMSAVGLLKLLLDALHYEELSMHREEQEIEVGALLTGIHVHHNIAFIEAGVNHEGSLPKWHPARW